jgi:hypothetical protein
MRNFRTNIKANGELGWLALVVSMIALALVLSFAIGTQSNKSSFRDEANAQGITIGEVWHVNSNTYNYIVQVNGYDLIQIAKQNNLTTIFYNHGIGEATWFYLIVNGTAYNYRP